MSNNNHANAFAKDESRQEETVFRSARASVFCPLHFGCRIGKSPQVSPEERVAEKLAQCRKAGQLGGRAKAVSWAPIREFVRQEAVKNRKSSLAKTAYAIAPAVLERASHLGVHMSPTNAVKKITEWLKDDELRGQR